MGLYINPENETKEEWLAKKGELLIIPKTHYKDGTKMVVFLKFNGPFNAAAVMYDQDEFEYFLDQNKPGIWYLVEEKDIKEVVGEEQFSRYVSKP